MIPKPENSYGITDRLRFASVRGSENIALCSYSTSVLLMEQVSATVTASRVDDQPVPRPR